MNKIKHFFKELKRVRWPQGKDINKTYWLVVIFVSIIAIVLFGLAVGLTALWNHWGVGING